MKTKPCRKAGGAAAAAPDFRGDAEKARRCFRENLGVRLGYDGKSLLRVDKVISDFWPARRRHPPSSLVWAWGCYVGECFRRLLGATWSRRNGNWILCVGEVEADVLGRVRSRFVRGMRDSIGLYYEVVRTFAAPRRPARRPSRRGRVA